VNAHGAREHRPRRRDASARFRRGLRRRVVVAIAVKLALLAVLYLMFFSPPHRPDVGDAAIDRHLLPNR
jgi:type II secretory pathway component PulM